MAYTLAESLVIQIIQFVLSPFMLFSPIHVLIHSTMPTSTWTSSTMISLFSILYKPCISTCNRALGTRCLDSVKHRQKIHDSRIHEYCIVHNMSRDEVAMGTDQQKYRSNHELTIILTFNLTVQLEEMKV